MGLVLQPEDYFVGPKDYTAKEHKLPEKKIEGASKKWARAHGWHVRKWSSPGNTGLPDDIFIKDGTVIFVEFKRVGKVPTGLQCDEAQQIREHGGLVYWTDTVRGTKLILKLTAL